MEKVVRFSKKSVKYTIAIVNWLIYSIIVGGTTTPVNDTFSNIWYFFSILLFIYIIFVSYYRNVNYKIIFLFAMVPMNAEVMGIIEGTFMPPIRKPTGFDLFGDGSCILV